MNKRSIIAATAICMTFFTGKLCAQVYDGGIPLSIQKGLDHIAIPVTRAPLPDWDSYLKEERQQNPEELFSKPLIAGMLSPVQFTFPESGMMTKTADGSLVWRGAISIAKAPSIGLYFERFYLPKGVKLFVTNDNKKQIIGAYDYRNNDASGKFAIDVLQGDKIWIELNIDPSVHLDAIKLYIDHAMVMYRGIEHLRQYALSDEQPIDAYDESFNGRSSICTINAICPQGSDYSISRRATVQTVGRNGNYVSFCSGTLINNTANTENNCRPLVLTAAHCEGTGSLNHATFDQTMIRFNFERPDCNGSSNTLGSTMTGVDILARSAINGSSAGDIDGDFMLFELRRAIPNRYEPVLSGWNRANNIPVQHTAPKKFIGFHHPAGDNKKLSTAQEISSRSTHLPGIQVDGNRWRITYTVGYVAGGSSGSGLFDGDGHLIGIASTGTLTNNPDSCLVNSLGQSAQIMRRVNYAKLWHSWDYNVDGPGDDRRLAPWLDPLGTGVEVLGPLQSCVSISQSENNVSIGHTADAFDQAVSLAPNPSFDGRVNIVYNLATSQHLDIIVMDINGKEMKRSHISNALSGTHQMDCSMLASGMYVVRIIGEHGITNKKLMLSHH